MQKITITLTLLLALLAACAPAEPLTFSTPAAPPEFDGERAYQDTAAQMAFGPRTPNSEGHAKIVQWLLDELGDAGWETEIQTAPHNDYTIQNVVAKQGSGSPWIILGAHYDTRIYADRDPDPAKRTEPMPGANDGASGVAVLTELARALPQDLNGTVWLVFFDAEDNGRIAGWDWILGSQAFVESLEGQPDAMVLVDMIGDADLQIYREKNSDPALTDEIWGTAESLGYGEQLISVPKYRMLDDHIPFLQAGIPAVDLIDFDYPYWHTTADTLDKLSPESLDAVGDTLLAWLLVKLAPETVP
jgi:Zn-dependent M28 family amino/carboxypeptidase